MARNKFDGVCYQCNRVVKAGTGHFERHSGGWRVKHANVPGDGRVTCEQVADARNATGTSAALPQPPRRTE